MNNRIAIVTGATSGIGEAIARAFTAVGNNVVIAGRNEAVGNKLAAELNALFIKADLAQSESISRIPNETFQRYGTIDILVNNAGFQFISPIEEFPEQAWHQMVAVMLTAPFLLTKQVWPFMQKQRWGRIINIASIHSQVASLYKSAYVTIKHGLIGLTRAAALEGGAHGITVNAICPAYVRTPLAEKQIDEQAKLLNLDRQHVEETVFFKSTVIKRLIEPEEVAAMAVYLCSDNAASITGSAWTIDCGWTAQ